MRPSAGVRSVLFQGRPAVQLFSERLTLVVLPAFGGRVASLTDLVTGRDWLVPGVLPDLAPANALYGPELAWGWDECLPTVLAGPDPAYGGGRLRDHGDLWGRAVLVEAEGDGSGSAARLSMKFDATAAGSAWSYLFRRRIELERSVARIEYELENRGERALPFLWSMHPLLALEPGSRLHLPTAAELRLTFAAGPAVEGLLSIRDSPTISWPSLRLPGGGRRELDTVPGLETPEALKLYAGPVARGVAAASGADGSWLGCQWDERAAPYLGIWLANGGWPSPETAVRQHALEPTTAPADTLNDAINDHLAMTLQPGARRAWWARLEVGTAEEDLAAFLAGASTGPYDFKKTQAIDIRKLG